VGSGMAQTSSFPKILELFQAAEQILSGASNTRMSKRQACLEEKEGKYG